METPKKPWNFCETPEEKCTMNYCDENGCQNRKRNLVEPWRTMEEINEGLKKARQEFLLKNNPKNACDFILSKIDKAIEKSTLEQQIEKLEADKAELLEAFKYANRMLKNSKDAMYDENYIVSLIQKHTATNRV